MLESQPAAVPVEFEVGSRNVALAALLSLFWVAYVWGFWSRGIHALGVNAALFLLGVIWLVVRTHRSRGLPLRSWRWLVPFVLLAASYALHDNSYLETINLFLFPIGLGTASLLNQRSTKATSIFLVSSMAVAIAGPVRHLRAAVARQVELTRTLPKRRIFRRRSLENRVLTGVVLSLVLIVGFVVPLLRTADDVFARRVEGAYDFTIQPLLDFFDLGFVWRALTFAVFSVVLVAYAQRVTEPFRPDESVEETPQDSVVAGIVLSGVAAVYLLFLWIQIERFWLGTLPADLETTARLVKSGFWQMIALTAFNVVLQMVTYRRTTAPVQRILLFFCGASTLLLVSAAHRMYLYVTIYGLSHEKYFASYAVVYCAFLFLMILWHFARRTSGDLIRTAALAALWVYAVTTILPVERVIFEANMRLAKREGSRINVDQMELLGPDVYPLVRERAREIGVEDYFELDERTRRSEIWLVPSDEATPWERWCAAVEGRLEEQKWYERSLSGRRARAALVEPAHGR